MGQRSPSQEQALHLPGSSHSAAELTLSNPELGLPGQVFNAPVTQPLLLPIRILLSHTPFGLH